MFKLSWGDMEALISRDKAALGAAAARHGAEAIRTAIARHGEATIIVATGASQFELLENLVAAEGIDWAKVSAFHLDEYIGLPVTHGASFRKYLRERFASKVPSLGSFVEIAGDAPDVGAEVKRLSDLISGRRVDVCFAGIGENCHLAFNDPPADFATEAPYLVVNLDEACRRQQLGEGWFPSLDAVPTQAISMSVRQIMKADRLVISVPDQRKAAAVQAALEGPVTPDKPASILQQHPHCTIFLDPAAASLLQASTARQAPQA